MYHEIWNKNKHIMHLTKTYIFTELEFATKVVKMQ